MVSNIQKLKRLVRFEALARVPQRISNGERNKHNLITLLRILSNASIICVFFAERFDLFFISYDE